MGWNQETRMPGLGDGDHGREAQEPDHSEEDAEWTNQQQAPTGQAHHVTGQKECRTGLDPVI